MTDMTKKQPADVLPPRKPKKERPPPCYTPNVVPLIDVLFMLLLFFLLSTRFRQEEGDIPGSLPYSGGTEEVSGTADLKQVEITVRPVGGEKRDSAIFELKNNNLEIRTADELYQSLQRVRTGIGAKADEAPVLISPTREVRWAFVVEAFNQAVRARFKNIGFIPPT